MRAHAHAHNIYVCSCVCVCMYVCVVVCARVCMYVMIRRGCHTSSSVTLHLSAGAISQLDWLARDGRDGPLALGTWLGARHAPCLAAWLPCGYWGSEPRVHAFVAATMSPPPQHLSFQGLTWLHVISQS